MGILDLFFKPEKRSFKKNVILDDICYKYQKRVCAKAIKITVKDPYTVNVTIPFTLTYKDGENFVKKNSDWIKTQIENFEFMKIDENFKTKTDNFLIKKENTDFPAIKQSKNKVTFICPNKKDIYSKEIQTELKKAVKKALYIEAKNYLPKRIAYLAQKHGFKYNKIFLKTTKTRWGSCSYRNNINLNINLMCLDIELIDYVLIHELAHTVEKNHKPSFWALVNRCLPDAYDLRKKLKASSPII